MKNNFFDIKNQIVVVTGGTKGIGNYISKTLSTEGCIVYSLGRSFSKTKKLGKLNNVKIDIRNNSEISKLFKDIYYKHKRINTLINCAGISFQNNTYDLNNFRETLEVNLNSQFNLSKEVFKYMKIKKDGSIINITSINSKMGFSNNPGYVSSKGALSALTKALSKDFGKYNIRVNSICPGYIKTRMTEKSFKNSKLSKQRISRNIIQRWGHPKDIVGAIILLSSKSSSYITGSEIVIDGGFSVNGI